ncbi:ribonuclease P protein component [uncultured Roseobacter sp.]|uniref:ribonuclease P protein component n=1 Tax=uncultured Roseobacter sp. TaxID=114847 RepID=UPI002633BA86|nr:ribonuclease P protein component [uncultured Roseobacter sp.]
MKPPQAPHDGSETARDVPAAVSARKVNVLQNRSDFLRAAKALHIAKPGFVLQMRRRNPGEADGIRAGFTCSKKVGNAVARNRAKRRLREIARLSLPQNGRDDTDYVLIGRREVTASMSFDRLQVDFDAALDALHRRLK